MLAIFHSCAVKGASHDVVSHAREIFDPATAHQYNAVLLEIVTLAANISDDLLSIGELDPCHFAQSRIGFFRGFGLDLKTNAAPLRTSLQRGGS